jgi:streptomycin 6-kinase
MSTGGDNFSQAADARRDALAREWGVTIERSTETPSSLLAFGRRGTQPVVLKLIKHGGDEWRAGEVASAFDGRGTARVYEWMDGAVLLERLDPGTALVELTRSGRDGEATAILADVMAAMAPLRPMAGCATVQEWGSAFGRHESVAPGRLPPGLLSHAAERYADLCSTQRNPRLLHGDLHHYNVLHDHDRGWLAIDPKGVVGEREYEVGAALRNPTERPEYFADRDIVARRVDVFASALGLDAERIVAWAFAQAVLSAIWDIEDGLPVHDDHPSLLLAQAIRPVVAR